VGFVINDLSKRWQGGRIPYDINAGVFPPGSANRQAVQQAIDTWNATSDVTLTPRQGQGDFALFTSGPACQSPVGRQGGSQQISCSVGTGGFGAGSVMHEIGHCFGLFHEHQRPDRNNFVSVTPGVNVNNLQILTNGLPIGGYDCCSIMHYPNIAGQIVNISPACASMGQRARLTEGDKGAIRFIYPLTHVNTLGDTSDLRIALAIHQGLLFLAWRGSGNDNLNLVFSTDGGATFTGKQTFGDTSSRAPALASHNGQLFLAWKGSGNDNLNVAQVDFSQGAIHGLTGKVTLGETSDMGPALASHDGRLFLAWRGSGNENVNLNFSEDNGRSFRGTKSFGDTSTDAPTITSHNGQLYFGWKGSGNDNLNVAIVALVSNGGGFGIDGFSQKTTLGETSDFSPALASQNGRLWLAFRGSGNENLNIIASDDAASTFVDKRVSFETSTDAPCLTGGLGRLFYGWKGSGNDNFNSSRVSLAPLIPELVGSVHSGNFLQSTFESQGNFEMLVPQGSHLVHLFRDNDAAGFPWIRSGAQPTVPQAGGGGVIQFNPTAVSVMQSNFLGDGVHGNFEAVVRMTPVLKLGENDPLEFYFFDTGGRQWRGPFPVQANGQAITGVTGRSALIQSTFGRQGNFELLVPQGNQLVHYFRDNDASALPWIKSGSQPVVPAGGGGVIQNSPTAVSLIQSNFKGNGVTGNLEAIVRMTPVLDPSGAGDFLDAYFFDSGKRQWNGPFTVTVNNVPISGVTGDPALVQSNFGQQGNFELLVPQGNQLVHYFRNNDAPGLPWIKSGSQPVVPTGGGGVISRNPTAVTLLQSNFRSNCVQGNLEAVVRMTPVLDPDNVGSSIAFYFFNSANLTWNGPAFIAAGGQTIVGVTGF
jgi:hypothetical protein